MKRSAALVGLVLLFAAVAGLWIAGRMIPSPAAVSTARFSTTDREGNRVDQHVFSGQKLIMLNFWEPWCPPCVNEMPDLEKLYRNYHDKGLLILGIYSTGEMEDDVDAVLQSCATSYPILHYTESFDRFQTGYVPTTVFLDGAGKTLHEPIPGSKDYAGWEALVLKYLK